MLRRLFPLALAPAAVAPSGTVVQITALPVTQ